MGATYVIGERSRSMSTSDGWSGHSGVLTNPGQRHCEARLACRGNLNSLHDLEFEIAALPAVARNDRNGDFFNTPERPGHAVSGRSKPRWFRHCVRITRILTYEESQGNGCGHRVSRPAVLVGQVPWNLTVTKNPQQAVGHPRYEPGR